MTQKQLTEHLVQLNRLHFVNAYLVGEADGFTLVDTGLKGAADQYIAIARALGGEIRRVALTHAHADHAGSLDGLRDLLGGDVQILFGDLDARVLAGEKVIAGKRRGSWPDLRTVPDVRLTGGERIGSLEVVATPGHTPGHMAFVDTRDRTLIAGDVFTTYWRTEIPNRLSQRFPLAAMGTQDRRQIVESARVLAALEPPLLVVGHGPAVRSPRAAIEAAVRRAAAVRHG